MAFTMPDIFKISVSGTCPTHSRTELTARHHEVMVDEPVARGGTDLAPTPLETLLSSYLACINVITNMIAEEKGIEIEGMSMGLTGHFDTTGVSNQEPATLPFPEIDLTVNIKTGAVDQRVEELKADLAHRCPVTVILRAAGTKINQTWNIERP